MWNVVIEPRVYIYAQQTLCTNINTLYVALPLVKAIKP